MFDTYLPPGWPPGVRPPGSRGWESTATAFLFDCCPPDFRSHDVLRRHLVVLARFAAEFVSGQCATAEKGIGGVRTSLAKQVPPEVIQSAAEAWLAEAARLARRRRAVELVEQALLGATFVRKL